MIKVGGATEVEVKEKKDRVEDALNATRAAVEEGIVPGGGMALLRAKKAVGKLTNDNADVQAGINIVLKAIEAPIRQIAENSGVEGSIVVGKIMESKSETFGFDAADRGVCRPDREGHRRPGQGRAPALQDAASVAGLLVTTEAMVAELPKEPAPAMPRRRHGRHGRHDVRRAAPRQKIKGAASAAPFSSSIAFFNPVRLRTSEFPIHLLLDLAGLGAAAATLALVLFLAAQPMHLFCLAQQTSILLARALRVIEAAIFFRHRLGRRDDADACDQTDRKREADKRGRHFEVH